MTDTCIICGHVQEVGNYDDWTCASCGQQYEYEERHAIVLSGPQVAALRNLGITRGCDGPVAAMWPRLVTSPLEQRLQGENDKLRRENDQLLESIKQQAYVVEAGATLNVPQATQVGHLFVYGTANIGLPDKSITYGLDSRKADSTPLIW